MFYIQKKEIVQYNIPALDLNVIHDSKDIEMIEIHVDNSENESHKCLEITYDEMIALNEVFNKILQQEYK